MSAALDWTKDKTMHPKQGFSPEPEPACYRASGFFCVFDRLPKPGISWTMTTRQDKAHHCSRFKPNTRIRSCRRWLRDFPLSRRRGDGRPAEVAELELCLESCDLEGHAGGGGAFGGLLRNKTAVTL